MEMPPELNYAMRVSPYLQPLLQQTFPLTGFERKTDILISSLISIIMRLYNRRLKKREKLLQTIVMPP
jgi:hypothetical protein